MTRRAVAILGAGAVTPFGPTCRDLREGLRAGRRALVGSPPEGRVDRGAARAALERVAPEWGERATSACEVWLAAALAEALVAAGLSRDALGGARTAVLLGTTKGAGEPGRGLLGLAPGDRAAGALGAPALFLARLAGARGEVLTLSRACASGSAAIAHGAALVRSGAAERAVVAGLEVLSDFVRDGFRALEAVDPSGARPFDRRRSGLSLGEGAAVLLLGADDGRTRRPRVRVAGAASATDAQHVTAPDPEGRALARAVREALARAGVSPGDVDLVAAHGTGTARNDAAEMRALAVALEGSRARVFSIKGAIGHTLGAAGTLDAVAALIALEDGGVPGTVGLETPLALETVLAPEPPDAGLVLPRTRELLPRARVALVTNAGFGGLDQALVLVRDDEAAARPPSETAPVAATAPRAAVTAFAWLAPGLEGGPARIPSPARDELDPERRDARFPRLDRAARLLRLAATRALGSRSVAGDRTALVLATVTGCLEADTLFEATRGRPEGASPALFPPTLPTAPAAELAIHLGLRGPVLAVSAGEASLLAALAFGLRLLASGEADRVLVAALELDGPDGPADEALTESVALVVLEPEVPTPSAPALAWLEPVAHALDVAESSPSPGRGRLLGNAAGPALARAIRGAGGVVAARDAAGFAAAVRVSPARVGP